MTGLGSAAALLAEARATIGMTEHPFGSNRQPFAECAGHANGYAWCLTWAVCMAKRAGVPLPRYDTAYTPTMAAAFQADDRWGARPSVGALVFFRWPNMGRISHVGIVEAVRPDGAIVTIEGNTDESGSRTGGKVMRHVRRANIVGYGYPRFGKPAAPPRDQENIMATLDQDDIKAIGAEMDRRLTAVFTGRGQTTDEAMFERLYQDVIATKAAVDKLSTGGGQVDYTMLAVALADELAQRLQS